MKSRIINFQSTIYGILLLLFLIQTNATAGWYNTNWQYRRPVAIPNPGSTVLSDFQVQVTLNSSFDFSKVNSDGSDIRFTSTDGVSLIPYWIETWNPVGLQAVIWVKVPTIPVSGTTVYLYYGNLYPNNPVETPPVGTFTRDASSRVVRVKDLSCFI